MSNTDKLQEIKDDYSWFLGRTTLAPKYVIDTPDFEWLISQLEQAQAEKHIFENKYNNYKQSYDLCCEWRNKQSDEISKLLQELEHREKIISNVTAENEQLKADKQKLVEVVEECGYNHEYGDKARQVLSEVKGNG